MTKTSKPKRKYTRKTKEEKPSEVSITGLSPEGTLVLDKSMLPPKFQALSIRVNGVDYAISMESIRCKLKELKDRVKDVSAEEALSSLSKEVSEQIDEVVDFAKDAQVKEQVATGLFEFLVDYFVKFVDSLVARVERMCFAVFALLCRFFDWLTGLLTF